MRPIKDELLQELATQMFAVFRTMKNEVGKTFESYIPMNEFVVLRAVRGNKKEMVSRVANMLNVSNSHITAVSERLIKKGLLQRYRSEADRRVVFLEITEKGLQLAQEMEEEKLGYIKNKFSVLTEDEIMTLIQIYKKLL